MEIHVRMAGEADAAGVRAVYAPVVETTAISFEVKVPSVTEMAARITGRQPAHPWLVAVDGDRVAGYAYAGPFAARAAYAWSVETSVYVAEWARRRGVGRALYGSLLAILGAQGYRRALAGIALPNAASVQLHEEMGFTQAGVYVAVGWKLGAWHDVGWWQRALGTSTAPPATAPPTAPPPAAPPPPMPFTDLPAGVLDAALVGNGR